MKYQILVLIVGIGLMAIFNGCERQKSGYPALKIEHLRNEDNDIFIRLQSFNAEDFRFIQTVVDSNEGLEFDIFFDRGSRNGVSGITVKCIDANAAIYLRNNLSHYEWFDEYYIMTRIDVEVEEIN